MTKMLRFGPVERSPRAAPILPGWGGAPKRATSSRSCEIRCVPPLFPYLANKDIATHKRLLVELGQSVSRLIRRLKLDDSGRQLGNDQSTHPQPLEVPAGVTSTSENTTFPPAVTVSY